jgi:hypothetical protein
MFKIRVLNKRLKETKAPLHSAFKAINLDDKQEIISLLFYRTKSKITGYTKFTCKMSIRYNDIKIDCDSISSGCGYDVRQDSFLNCLAWCEIGYNSTKRIEDIIEGILRDLNINNTLIIKINA